MNQRDRRGSIILGMNQIWLLLLVVWVLMIFGHSLTPAELSSKESSWVMDRVLQVLKVLGNDGQWLTGHIVRKSAHFVEYCIFGFLLIQNFHSVWKSPGWKLRWPQRGKIEKFIPVAFAVLAVPFCDETIQLFTPGRAGMLADVWLDMSGAFSGILLWEAVVMLSSLVIRRRPLRLRRSRW